MAVTRKIFYSFHFDNDVFRVQLIRNIGALEGNEPVKPNEWEAVKRGGETSIKRWINDNMYGRSCVVVLIGEETWKRPWVIHEIQKAWNESKTLLGIYIHNVNCMRNGKCSKGHNPFDYVRSASGTKLSELVLCYDPKYSDAYNDIRSNMENWIESAIQNKSN